MTPTEPTKLVELGPLDAIQRERQARTSDRAGSSSARCGGSSPETRRCKQLQGPVGIAQLSGEAAQISVLSLLCVHGDAQPESGTCST